MLKLSKVDTFSGKTVEFHCAPSAIATVEEYEYRPTDRGWHQGARLRLFDGTEVVVYESCDTVLNRLSNGH